MKDEIEFMNYRILIIGFFLLLSSCTQVTQTNTVSYTDPAWRGKTFSALIVETDGAGLQEQLAIERTTAQDLKQAGINSGASVDYIPPTRNYGERANRHILAQTQSDGVLVVTPTEKQTVSRYYPGSPELGVFGGSGGYTGAGVNFGMPYYDPGYTVQEPIVHYTVTLYSVPRFARVWQAEFVVHGAGGMSYNTIAARFSEQLVQRLMQDGLIARR
jgi:hypothetical protein